MAEVTFHLEDGTARTLEVAPGVSVMRAALENGVPGIVGECGGQAMCATCHVLVRPGHPGELPEIGPDEDEMLDCTSAPRDSERSRLGCQLVLGVGSLQRLEVDVAARQV